MIWHHEPTLADLNSRSVNTMAENMGIEFTEIGADYLKARMPVDTRTKQPLGILNGGASCALVETLASTAANYCVDQALGYCVGLDLNANHLRSAYNGYVTALTKPIHLGRSTQVWSVDIFGEDGKQICVARMTMAVLQRK
ncbi:MAG: ydiI [Gammaproteobacteria bacterium]|jgi:1,4-dihydroxy-2-naphthoyl-CoA hydrolase|nr:ydiI [Gammaproteobacteria bacterium]